MCVSFVLRVCAFSAPCDRLFPPILTEYISPPPDAESTTALKALPRAPGVPVCPNDDLPSDCLRVSVPAQGHSPLMCVCWCLLQAGGEKGGTTPTTVSVAAVRGAEAGGVAAGGGVAEVRRRQLCQG